MLRGARALGIPADAQLVLAVSGGPDSVALLHGAANLARTDAVAWRLTVAHLDHGLRPESGEDGFFVGGLAASLDLPFASRRTDVAALARDEHRSLEEAGREARYRFMVELAGSDGLIATAHTADDAAETVLINLLRGSGLAGASGIPVRRGNIVRPLIAERRATLRSVLDEAQLAYRLDPSNEDPAFLRNRVRAELLPLLEQLRPAAVESIARFASLAADDDALLDAVAAMELGRRTDDTGTLDWHAPPDRALGRRMLRLAIGDPAPSAERIEALLEAAEGPRGGLRIELGAGRSASVRERIITIE
ncbi:MAG: tRNA lysidine(34) synthetase TilS [Chloroflexota bacterium]